MKYTNQQKFLRDSETFVFESICVREYTFRKTETALWIGSQVPISVSISSIFVTEPFIIHVFDPNHLIEHCLGAQDNLGSQSKQTEALFLDISAAIKSKLGEILEKPTQ